MKFIDFFAGIGGIRLGLERAGHKCVGFCEWDKFARQSYKAMYDTEGEWENHDIRTAKSYGLPSADLWCFGFPCQDLSVAGKRKGLQEGERSGLFYEIVRLLQGLRQEDRPKWLLAENVKGLFSAGRGFDFLRCILELGQLGYNIEYQLLNSKDFGVPQNRERVFIVGRLGEGSGRKVFPLRRTDGENTCKLQEITSGVSDAFRVYDGNGLARTLKGEAGGGGAKTGLYTIGDIKLIGNYMPSGHSAGNVYDGNGIAPTVMDNHGLASAVAIDMTENKPAITENVRCLKARYTAGVTNFSGDNSGILQELRIRKLTPRECWRLQGFLDEYFDRAVAAGVSNSQLYKQAGNSVTVNVAEAIGRRLKEIEVSE